MNTWLLAPSFLMLYAYCAFDTPSRKQGFFYHALLSYISVLKATNHGLNSATVRQVNLFFFKFCRGRDQKIVPEMKAYIENLGSLTD